MDQAEFDRFADEYHDQHRENVAVTGERPEYFAEYKIRKLRQVVDRSGIGVSRICGSGIGNPIPFARNLAQQLAEAGWACPRIRYNLFFRAGLPCFVPSRTNPAGCRLRRNRLRSRANCNEAVWSRPAMHRAVV